MQPIEHVDYARIQWPVGKSGVIGASVQRDRSYGIFQAHFDNSKRRAGREVRCLECYGALYPDGNVHLHTAFVQVQDFVSLQEMYDYLRAYGTCTITWLDEEQ